MSYGFESPCFNCEKLDKCTDHVKVVKAINDIHTEHLSSEQGHMGAGSIILFCHRIDAKDK